VDDEQKQVFAPQYKPAPTLRPSEGEPERPRFAPAYQGRRGVQAQPANRGQTPNVVFNQWRGMFSNANPHVIGTQYLAQQTNLTSVVTGQLQVRSGLRAVVFDVDV
jgi:hypothetical protein